MFLIFTCVFLAFLIAVCSFVLYKFSTVEKTKESKEAEIAKYLEGYWESGYDYYFEIKGNRLTVLEYSKRKVLETPFTLTDVDFEDGSATLALKKPLLTYEGADRPYGEFTSLRLINGKLELSYRFTTVDGDRAATLEKKEHDAFYNVEILDDSLLPELQGSWSEVSDSDVKCSLSISGDKLTILFGGSVDYSGKIHVISYKTSPGHVYVVNASLTTVSTLGPFKDFTYSGGVLTTEMTVLDADESPRFTFTKDE